MRWGPVVHARSSQSDSDGVCRASVFVGRSAGFALEFTVNYDIIIKGAISHRSNKQYDS